MTDSALYADWLLCSFAFVTVFWIGSLFNAQTLELRSRRMFVNNCRMQVNFQLRHHVLTPFNVVFIQKANIQQAFEVNPFTASRFLSHRCVNR